METACRSGRTNMEMNAHANECAHGDMRKNVSKCKQCENVEDHAMCKCAMVALWLTHVFFTYRSVICRYVFRLYDIDIRL